MSNVIVKYHNDFNKIQLPSFTEQEQNMLFSILAKVRDAKGDKIRLFTEDILVGKVESSEYFTAVMDSLKHKFFKASFRQIIETETEIIDSHFHLFNTMDIHYQKKDPNDMYDNSKIFCYIDLAVNERFAYLINELTANFTRFELTEFISLSGKYTKTLYRLLKQYRNTGYMRMEWQEFIRVMDIPKSYKMCDIDKDILKPAIKELTKPRNLFDRERIPFKNLTYTKIKNNGRGRGGKVVGIEFRFNIETETIQSNDYFTEAYQAKIKALEGRYIDKMRIDGSWLLIDKVEFDYGAGKIKLRLGEKGKKDSIRKRYTKEELEKEVLPFISKEFK